MKFFSVALIFATVAACSPPVHGSVVTTLKERADLQHLKQSTSIKRKLCVLYSTTTSTTTTSITSLLLPGSFSIEEIPIDKSCLSSASSLKVSAEGTYDPSINQTGWNVLNITTNSNSLNNEREEEESQQQFLDNNAQAYSAGFLEGYATHQELVFWYINNFGNGSSNIGLINDRVNKYFLDHIEWLEKESLALEQKNATWRNIALLWRQTEGMRDGANKRAAEVGAVPFTKLQFWYMLGMTDLTSDICDMYPSTGGKEKNRTVFDIVSNKLHCSGLVAVSPDLTDIFFGHTTWMRYNTMVRVYKVFTMNFQNVPGFTTRTIQFSSYPGTLSSTDDFYLLVDSGFAVVETSLYMFNKNLYVHNKPQQLLSNLRTMLANRMVTSAPQWADTFSYLNSGTYNNQWMVIDLNLFTPGQDLKPNTFWVVEQLPGLVKGEDQTRLLSFGYFPSYNIAFYREVWELADFPSYAKQEPQWFSYENSARAKIYRQIARNISTMEEFQYIMRYNSYKTDPLAQHDPWYAIAARGDLMPAAGGPHGEHADLSGGIDSKVSSFRKWKNSNIAPQSSTVLAISGPTTQHNLPPWDWENPPGKYSKNHQPSSRQPPAALPPHFGLPRIWNFTWQEFHA